MAGGRVMADTVIYAALFVALIACVVFGVLVAAGL